MDWNQVEHDWQRFRPAVKSRWERLSDNELKLVNGKREELCAKIQQAYGVSRDEAQSQITAWLNAHDHVTQGAQQ